MAHYALVINNIVQRINVIDNNLEDELGEQGIAEWCSNEWGGQWIKCSYNNKIRNKYPNIGDEYHPDLDKFITPAIDKTWRLDNRKGEYVAPVEKPDNVKNWTWDKNSQSWKEFNILIEKNHKPKV